jgi:hypothetical protein
VPILGVNDRALYLAIRLISRLRELDEAHLLEPERLPRERSAERTEAVAAVLGDEEGISDPVSVQLVLAALPGSGSREPPSKEAVREFADFLENQLHLSENLRE